LIGIEKKEAIVLISLISFSIIWIAFVIPYLMQSQWFKDLIPPLQYLIFNCGFVTVFLVIIGAPLSYLINGEIDIKGTIRYGVISWLILSFVYDLWEPPYYVSYTGEPILFVPGALTGTAVDATILWIWQNLGISGPILFYSVYLITPLLIALFIAILLKPKEFLELITP